VRPWKKLCCRSPEATKPRVSKRLKLENESCGSLRSNSILCCSWRQRLTAFLEHPDASIRRIPIPFNHGWRCAAARSSEALCRTTCNIVRSCRVIHVKPRLPEFILPMMASAGRRAVLSFRLDFRNDARQFSSNRCDSMAAGTEISDGPGAVDQLRLRSTILYGEIIWLDMTRAKRCVGERLMVPELRSR
jgi:hypothetical protein